VSHRPIRILHLLNAMVGGGCGIVNAALDIFSGQLKEPIEIAVCAGHGEMTHLLDCHGIRHFRLNQQRSAINLLRAALSFRRIVAEFQPDIVHTHMVTGTLMASTARLGSQYGIVAHLHNVHQRSARLMAMADRVIAVSDAVAHDLIRNGVHPPKIRVVHNGILGSFRLSDPETTEAKALMQPAIVTVAGMNHRKGISELIAAFEKVCERRPGGHLYLVGSGPNRAEFEARASVSPVYAQIHFEGFQADPVPYMKAASVFVLASRRESFGLVLTEARRCRCAIVATSVDGILEAMDGGRAGILVPPQDPDALAAGLLRALESPARNDALRTRASEHLESFRVERVATQITEVYRELIGCPGTERSVAIPVPLPPSRNDPKSIGLSPEHQTMERPS
jgi:glycosyltransferase involved in cell wall biosynthesis